MKKIVFKREECIGGCGRLVLHGQGECRKCRRQRIHSGLKFIMKSQGRSQFRAELRRKSMAAMQQRALNVAKVTNVPKKRAAIFAATIGLASLVGLGSCAK